MENAAVRTSHKPVADDSGTIHGKLPISSPEPTQVWIGKFIKDGTTIAGFAASASGPFYRGGIEWTTDSTEYGMFLSFQFLPGVSEVDCDDLLYSPVVGATQQMSVPPKKHSYDFFVTFDTGDRHDPKIIVTPITMPDPNC